MSVKRELRPVIALVALAALGTLGACADDDQSPERDLSTIDASVDSQQAEDSGQSDLGVDSSSNARSCEEDDDCTEKKTPLCDTVAGRCVGCLQDNDCKEPYAPRCAPATKTCVECYDHAQCANATNGSRCVEGVCSCESAADCTADEVWGSRCVELEMMGYTFHMCGCQSGTDCADSRYGPRCYAGLNQCSCAENSECSAPRSACARPASVTDYSFCQAPCGADDDCAGRMALTHCDTASGACVECLGNDDCAQSPFGAVCATDEGVLTGSCVCNTVDDCPIGKHCAADAFGLMSCQ